MAHGKNYSSLSPPSPFSPPSSLSLCPSQSCLWKAVPQTLDFPLPPVIETLPPQTMPSNRTRFKYIFYIDFRNGKLCRFKIENYQDWVVQRKILTCKVQRESKPKSSCAHSPGRNPRGQEQRKLKIKSKILGSCLLFPSYVYETVLQCRLCDNKKSHSLPAAGSAS